MVARYIFGLQDFQEAEPNWNSIFLYSSVHLSGFKGEDLQMIFGQNQFILYIYF